MARIAPKDLAGAVAAAKPGDRIELEAGEFVGQVVIDKPLVIEGRGAGTWLGNRTGPVLIIRSPDVELHELQVEMTGDLQHPAILVEGEREPVQRNVTLRRGELRAVGPVLRFSAPPAIRLQEHTPSAPPQTVKLQPSVGRAPTRPPSPPAETQPASPAPNGLALPRWARWGSRLIQIVVTALVIAAVHRCRSESKPAAPSGPVTGSLVLPSTLAPDGPTSPHELLLAERAAIAAADEEKLAALIAPDAFGFGTDAREVAYSGRQLAKMIIRALRGAPSGGYPPVSTFEQIGTDGDVAWIVDDLGARTARFATSQLAVRRGGRWSVAAWHWSIPVTDRDACTASAAGELPELFPVRDLSDLDGGLYITFGLAFGSQAEFVAALGQRSDRIDLGSVGERSVGAKIQQEYRRRSFNVSIDDNIAVGRATPRAGWGAANVTYSWNRGASRCTVHYRVLAVLLKEGEDWRIVLSHWSNGAPVPS